ncbi:MAG: pilus assembly protein TadG-related protein [Phaeospirillum sp.]|nr:pilus assembly protein TadG-related protein [Phaeospirillum sp.]
MKPRRLSHTVFGRMLCDQRGAVAVLAAVGMTAMLGFLSLGTEMGLWYSVKRSLQTAADAAALGGAFELGAGGSSAAISAAAVLDAKRNNVTVGHSSTVTIHSPPLTGKYVGDARAVEVTLSQEQALLFSTLFLNSAKVSARAVARVSESGDPCILALNKVTSETASFTGSTTITLNKCGITANSTSPQAVAVSGNATVNTAFIQSAGGYDVSGSGVLNAGSISTNAAPVADPFASLTAPTPAACKSQPNGNDFVLSEGTYCGGLDLKGNVTLNPGVYVIKGDTLKINAQASVSGTGVTIILTGDAGTGYAKVDINGGGAISITAPTTGTWAGVAFYGDRKAPNQVNKFNGNSVTNITGAIYMPSQELDFSGGNATVNAGCTRLIADSVKFIGNSSIGSNCSGTGLSSGATIKPTLVE